MISAPATAALSYLRDLPIDEVKLDRLFVGPILVDPRAAAIVHAVVDLAHVLGVTTVAEGVEDDETAARLREYGCDFVQGFYCSPPVSATAILELLRDGRQACACGEVSNCRSVETPLVQSHADA